MMKRAVIPIATIVALARCGGPGLGSRVAFDVWELPAPLVSGVAGSCMNMRRIGYPEANGFKWAPGARLEVRAYWPDRTDCTGFLEPVCPRVRPAITMVNPGVWNSTLVEPDPPAAVAMILMEAIGVGRGGFKITVDGAGFSPDFLLSVDQPTAIWFERSNGPNYQDVIAGPISELVVAAGHDAAVAVTLRDAAGEHICGPVPATVAVVGSTFSLDHWIDSNYANFPYHVIAGNTQGADAIQFRVGDLSASLPVSVGP
jgi:hypothetical protein